MGTLLALVAVVCAVGGPVAAIKPVLVGQSSRFKALVFCWGLAAISMLFGMAFDGRLGWGEVAAYSAVLLGLYVLLTYIIASVRVARMSPEFKEGDLIIIDPDEAPVLVTTWWPVMAATKPPSRNTGRAANTRTASPASNWSPSMRTMKPSAPTKPRSSSSV